jgi:hypothetical protein
LTGRSASVIPLRHETERAETRRQHLLRHDHYGLADLLARPFVMS